MADLDFAAALERIRLLRSRIDDLTLDAASPATRWARRVMDDVRNRPPISQGTEDAMHAMRRVRASWSRRSTGRKRNRHG